MARRQPAEAKEGKICASESGSTAKHGKGGERSQNEALPTGMIFKED